jgi:hypothetical protein
VEKDKNGKYHAADLINAKKLASIKKMHGKNLQELELTDPKDEALFKFYESTKGQMNGLNELQKRVTQATREQEFAS